MLYLFVTIGFWLETVGFSTLNGFLDVYKQAVGTGSLKRGLIIDADVEYIIVTVHIINQVIVNIDVNKSIIIKYYSIARGN